MYRAMKTISSYSNAKLVIVGVASLALCGSVAVSGKAAPQTASVAQDSKTSAHYSGGKLLTPGLPNYPKDALAQKLQGTAAFLLTIASDGSVRLAVPIGGDPRLISAVEKSIVQRKYEPFQQEGNAVEMQIKTTVYFAIPPVGPTVFAVDDMDLNDGLDGVEEFKPGKGIIAARPIYAPDPPYSEKAQKDRYGGTCVLSLVIGTDGLAHHIKPLQIVGDGLDEIAIDTVKSWRFEPAIKGGSAIPTKATVEVAFATPR